MKSAEVKLSPTSGRSIALYLTGLAVFIGLYLPQPILPLLARNFRVEPPVAALLISATIFGIAIASPVIGVTAERFGRKRVLVLGSIVLTAASLACALAPSFELLLLSRLLFGLSLPALMAVGVAYLADSMEAGAMRTVAGIYVASNVIGGMLGRVLAGAFADTVGWRFAFLLSAGLFFLLIPMWGLSRDAGAGVTGTTLRGALLGTLSHLRNRQLLGGLLIGFFLFFAFQSTFSYLPFHLTQPPFSLSNTVIGLTYLTYSAGVLSSAFAGWYSNRTSLLFAITVGFVLAISGNLLALVTSLPVLVVGLVVLCLGNFLVQGLAVGFVATATEHDRAGANALYLLLYYLGGSLGAFLPGFLYPLWGYGGVIISSIAALGAGVIGALLLVRAPRAELR